MKRLLFFLIVVVGLFPYDSYGQRMEDTQKTDIHYKLRGRPQGEHSVMGIANATNISSYPIYFVPDYTIGKKYVLELYVNGKFFFGESFHISDQLIESIRRHLASPNTGESIAQICATQASAMLRVFREGAHLQKDELTKLAAQKNDCNCPDPDLRRNFDNQVDDFPIKGLGDDGRYLIMSDQQARATYPNFDELVKNNQVKRTWLGKNWWWVVPVGLAVIGVGIAYAKGAFTKTKKTYIPYDDPDSPYYDPGHNPNQRTFFDPGEIFQQIKNIALPEFTQQQQQPLMVAIPL